MRNGVLIAAIAAALVSCGTTVPKTMTFGEEKLIDASPEVMRILSVDNPKDVPVLRRPSRNFNLTDINSARYQTLARKLVKTLESTDGGVGLAAPQVGINRRVVAVQRVDKEGEPIEVYPNIRIEEFRGEMEEGPEGCLSVPNRRGNVSRWQDIEISYSDPETLKDTTERIAGFTAVIFQHECDHLLGILYTDKL